MAKERKRRESVTPSIQSSQPKPRFNGRSLASLFVGILAVAGLIYRLSPVSSYIVIENCDELSSPLLKGKTVAVPLICDVGNSSIKNAFYYDSDNFSDFAEFEPCADSNSAVRCIPEKSRAAFVEFGVFSTKALFNVVYFTKSESRARKLLRFQLAPTEIPLFEDNNLLCHPTLKSANLHNATAKQTVHYILPDNTLATHSVHQVAFRESLKRLCELDANVTVWLMNDENRENILFLKEYNCVTTKVINYDELCTDLPCEEYYEGVLIDKENKREQAALHSLAKYAILAKYNGWYFDTAMVVRNIPEVKQTTFSSVEDNYSIIQPSCGVCYATNDETFHYILKAFTQYYNPDCSTCLDLDLIKFVFEMSKNLDLFSSDVYLPQLTYLDVYKQGKFDNDLYNDIIGSKWFWHLRYGQQLSGDVCASEVLLYELALEQIIGEKLCEL